MLVDAVKQTPFFRHSYRESRTSTYLNCVWRVRAVVADALVDAFVARAGVVVRPPQAVPRAVPRLLAVAFAGALRVVGSSETMSISESESLSEAGVNCITCQQA